MCQLRPNGLQGQVNPLLILFGCVGYLGGAVAQLDDGLDRVLIAQISVVRDGGKRGDVVIVIVKLQYAKVHALSLGGHLSPTAVWCGWTSAKSRFLLLFVVQEKVPFNV